MNIEKESNALASRDYKQPKCISLYRHSFKGFKGYEDVSVSLKSTEGSGNQVLVIDRSKCVCNKGKVCDVCCNVCGNYKDECICEKSIELKELTKGVSQAMRIFDSEGVGCTLRGLGGGMGAKTGLYAVGCAYRGRTDKEGNNYLNFESNKEEISNSLTSCQKDFMVVSHSLYPRSSITGKGGSGHLSKEDGASYCLDSGNCQAVEFKDPTCLDLYNKKYRTDVSITLSEPHHNNLRLGVGTQVRRLTPKECFRLQGFLNDEVNLEGLSDTQKYKLAGNGQSVNVVKLILKELM
jgi:DNA (cytosine-5)-methyltransferase 1